jgi:hypothetical protein
MMSTSHIQSLRAMLREEKGVILPGAPNALAAKTARKGLASLAMGLSRYRNDDAKRDCCAKLQAAATTSRHVLIAAARRTRCA